MAAGYRPGRAMTSIARNNDGELFLPETTKFWLAVCAAIVLKLATVRSLSFWGVCVSVTSALSFAVFFTGPVID